MSRLALYDPFVGFRNFNNIFNRSVESPRVDGASRTWSPRVDIVEEKDKYVLAADVPGVAPGDISVTAEQGVLTITGERADQGANEEAGYRRVERVRGRFSRSFELPDNVDAETISAKGENGVLRVIIPKSEAVKPKRIEVQS
ncbi:MAG: Hsp20/alpha crystallin family protein [Pseudomonadota bacterium]